ncbi:MAG: ImmA/IrrE family metallo-endopeptidase [Oscillospiraceae bacterium]|nr:ImmA/IrrE family metallo-endopeptidase [Oscillospiraceae bacterium]
MEKILTLYDELNRAGVRFYHWDLDDGQACTVEMNGQYGVFMDFGNIRTAAEELVAVAHEGGHVSTGSTHKVSSPYDLVAKHEYKADKWAVQKLISADALDAAVADGHTDIYSLAEHFNVTVPFMKKAVCLHTHGNLASDLYF